MNLKILLISVHPFFIYISPTSELHKELPSRRRGRGKSGGRPARGRGKRQEQEAPLLVQVKEEPVDTTIYIKSEPADVYCMSPVKKAERIR